MNLIFRFLLPLVPLFLCIASCGDENVELITNNRDFISPNQIATDTLVLEQAENFRSETINTRGSLLGTVVLPDARTFTANTIFKFVPLNDTGLVRAVSAKLRLKQFVDNRTLTSNKSVSFEIRRVQGLIPARADSLQWQVDSVFTRTQFDFGETLGNVAMWRVGDTTERVIELPLSYATLLIESAKRGVTYLRDTAAVTIGFVLTKGDSITSLSLLSSQLEITYDKQTQTTIERVNRFLDVQDGVYTVQTSPDMVPKDGFYITSSTGDLTRLKFNKPALSKRTQLISARLLLTRDTLFSFFPDTSRSSVDNNNRVVLVVDTLAPGISSDYQPVSMGYINENQIYRYRADVTDSYQRAISRNEDIVLILRPFLLQSTINSFKFFGNTEPEEAKRPRLIISYIKEQPTR